MARLTTEDFARQYVEPALGGIFDDPELLATITESDAYGALVYLLRTQCAGDPGRVPEILAGIEDRDIDFAAERADDPAAFLAAKVRDL